MRRRIGSLAVAAFALVIAFQPAWAQRPPPDHPVFGHTLMQGSGFIATPHAFVSHGVLFVTGTAIAPEEFAAGFPYTVTRGSVGLGLGNFIEVGGTVHTIDQYSGFGKLQVIRQGGIFPAMAVGVQNLTTFELGRYGIEDPFYADIQDALTIYGVATYVVGPGGRGFPSWVVLSAGWGTGLFSQDNPQIDPDGVRSVGLFAAVAFDFMAGDDAFIRFIWEYDGFDINASAVAYLAGLEFSAGVLSVGKGGALEPEELTDPLDPTQTFAGHFYNQVKPFVQLTVDFRALGALPWIWTSDEE